MKQSIFKVYICINIYIYIYTHTCVSREIYVYVCFTCIHVFKWNMHVSREIYACVSRVYIYFLNVFRNNKRYFNFRSVMEMYFTVQPISTLYFEMYFTLYTLRCASLSKTFQQVHSILICTSVYSQQVLHIEFLDIAMVIATYLFQIQNTMVEQICNTVSLQH